MIALLFFLQHQTLIVILFDGLCVDLKLAVESFDRRVSLRIVHLRRRFPVALIVELRIDRLTRHQHH